MNISQRILQDLYTKYNINTETNVFDIENIMSKEDFDKFKMAMKFPNGKPTKIIKGEK